MHLKFGFETLDFKLQHTSWTCLNAKKSFQLFRWIIECHWMPFQTLSRDLGLNSIQHFASVQWTRISYWQLISSNLLATHWKTRRFEMESHFRRYSLNISNTDSVSRHCSHQWACVRPPDDRPNGVCVQSFPACSLHLKQVHATASCLFWTLARPALYFCQVFVSRKR